MKRIYSKPAAVVAAAKLQAVTAGAPVSIIVKVD
jgi:hypothetical protein